MRASICAMTMILLTGAAAVRAEEPIKPEQLKKAYDNVLVQLKAAQDRKAELAKDNDALAAKVEDLKKQLAAVQGENETMKREIADFDEHTFYLRSYQSAWQGFLRRYPQVMVTWKSYLGDSILCVPRETPDLLNPGWPLPAPTPE